MKLYEINSLEIYVLSICHKIYQLEANTKSTLMDTVLRQQELLNKH
jgi:hypothetical protein